MTTTDRIAVVAGDIVAETGIFVSADKSSSSARGSSSRSVVVLVVVVGGGTMSSSRSWDFIYN
jgi:hypothetical protein